MVVETCDFCGDKGQLGPHAEIGAFRFKTPSGAEVIRYLHRTGSERRCYHYYEAKYVAWLEQQRARTRASSG